MNARRARAHALHAAALQVDALLEAEFLYGFDDADQPKVERELEHIRDRLFTRAHALAPDVDGPAPPPTPPDDRVEATCDPVDGVRHAIDPTRCPGDCYRCPGCPRCSPTARTSR